MRFFDDLVQHIGLLLIVINAILYTKSYILNKKNVALLFLFLYLIICSVVMIISSILGYKGEDNLHLSHIYFIAQFICLSLFYRALFKPLQRKATIIVLVTVVATLTIQYIKKPYLINQFNLFEIFITSFPLIIYSIIHLYNSLNKKGEYMLINSGVLIYITTSTLIFILGDYLSKYSGDAITSIWMINKILYIIYLLLILMEWKKLNLQHKKKS